MKEQSGFMKLIILIIIVVFILSYFGINLRSIVNNEDFQNNLNYVWGGVKYVWHTYLANPAKYLWYNIFIDLLWDSFVENMQRIKQGQDIEMIENMPRIK